MTLSGVQAALFSSLGLMGAAIANTESRFRRVDAALIRGLDPALGPACRNIVPDNLVPAGELFFSELRPCSVSWNRKQMKHSRKKRPAERYIRFP